MSPEKCHELLGLIYSLFGKKAPERGSAIENTIVLCTGQVPDSLMGYIFEIFQRQDSMPQNLSKAILGAWETWQMENPRAVYRESCRTCGGEGGFDCWQPDGEKVRHFFAFCPACQRHREGHLYLTPKQWKARGVLVMPVGYPGGKLAFETENGIREAVEEFNYIEKSRHGLHMTMNRRTGYARDYAQES